MEKQFKVYWCEADQAWYEQEEGTFKKKIVRHKNERRIDIMDYAQKLENLCNQCDAEGYDIVSVIPISRGSAEMFVGTTIPPISHAITGGAVVVGKRRSADRK